MSTFPARVGFPRSVDSGVVPEVLSPGSFSVNLIDRKVYAGGLDGVPVPVSQMIDDWSSALIYRKDDIVVVDGGLHRARANLSPGTPFGPEYWEALTADAGRTEYAEPYATSILSGGAVSLVGTTGIAVEAGSGVVVNRDIPNHVTTTLVTWEDFTVTVGSSVPGPWSAIGIDASGTLVEADYSAFSPAWRRHHIMLAFLLLDSAGEIVELVDASMPAAGTAEAFRDAFHAEGGAYRASGLRVKPYIAFKLQLTAGTVFDLGATWRLTPEAPHVVPLPAQVPLTFAYCSREARLASGVSDFDVTRYDNGGVLTPVPATRASIQYVSIAPDGSTYVQYGQATYSSTAEALASIVNDRDAYDVFSAGGPLVVLAAIILPRDAISMEDFGIVIASGRGSDAFVGSIPVGGDGGDFLLTDGSRPMSGPLNMGGHAINNADIDGGAMT